MSEPRPGSVLDSLEKMQMIDAGEMLKAIEDFPEQCLQAVKIAKETLVRPGSLEGVSNILLAGMGGSGIGGDLTRMLGEDKKLPPLQVIKGYRLPDYAGPDSLFIAVSYSGNTEETLSCFRQALKKKTRMICLTSGGQLAEEGRRLGLPMIKIPPGLQPRAALGFLFLPLLTVISGLAPDLFDQGEFDQTIGLLNKMKARLGPAVPLKQNEAKQVASKLYGKIPVIYGSEGPSSLAALRWKCQLNENSKIPAFCHFFPELNHNEMVGWDVLKEKTSSFVLVLFREEDETAKIKKRIEVTRSLIGGDFSEVIEIRAEGQSRLTKVMSLIYLGDHVSVYLAFLNGVDPSPVNKIAFLKERLAEVDSG